MTNLLNARHLIITNFRQAGLLLLKNNHFLLIPFLGFILASTGYAQDNEDPGFCGMPDPEDSGGGFKCS